MTGTEVLIEPGRQDIVVTRTFDAPREVVFKAGIHESMARLDAFIGELR
ncbi:hypothetical protein [Micromonospora sp. CPCC 206061]